MLFPEGREALLRIWGDVLRYTLFYTILTTGMRSGEARALRWKQVDLEKKVVSIEKAVKLDSTIGSTKAGYTRVAFFPERTVRLLEEFKALSPYTEEDDLVFFGTARDEPYHRNTILTFYRQGLKAAGIKTRGRVLDIQALRHTYNTLLRQVLPEEMLRLQIGHKSVSMTDNYDQATPVERLRAFKGYRGKISFF